VKSRRTDLVSESVDALPGYLRVPVWLSVALMKVVRVFILLQAVGGLVGLVIAVVTVNGPLAAGASVQLVLGGLVLGMGGGSEQIVEASGPRGAFVVRTGARRRRQDLHGLDRVPALLIGDRAWRATVRRRQDDPFGQAVAVAEVATERAAVSAAQEFGKRIRAGDDLTAT
jgi:hypothetical protein